MSQTSVLCRFQEEDLNPADKSSVFVSQQKPQKNPQIKNICEQLRKLFHLIRE